MAKRRTKRAKQLADKRAARTHRAANPGGASNYFKKKMWLLRHPDILGFMRHCVPGQPWK